MFHILLPLLSFSIHLGIDFGSHFSKTAISSSQETPDIAINYESKRLTPTFIGFRASSEFDIGKPGPFDFNDGKYLKPNFGNSAIEIMSLRPWLGTGFLPAFLDLEHSEAEKLAKSLFVNTSAAKLSLAESTTIFFKLYIDCVAQGKPVSSVAVVVPSIYTLPQRREIETAIRGAGFKFLGAIDDVEAVSNSYSLEKTNKFSQQPKTVLFIDIGATSIKAYCITFEIKKDESGKFGNAVSTRLSYSYANGQGGAYLTGELVSLIKNKLNLSDLNPAADLRLCLAAEKLKIQLTLLKSATTVVENINGEDKEITVTREELESVATSLINTTLEVAKNASEGIEYEDIELIGGCSRVPVILASIQEYFQKEFIGHSLNADEALAMGAGYYTQFRAGISRFQSVKLLTPKPLYNISTEIENETIPICVVNESCLDNITINTSVTQFDIIYDSLPESLKLKTDRFGYKVEMKPNSTLLVRFSHTPLEAISGRICVNKTICQYAPLIPSTPIYAASPNYHAIITADSNRKRLGRIRNDLEHFTLRVIDEVEHNESVRSFTNDMQRFKISKVAEKVRKWIWEEADSVSDEKNFTSRFNEIRDQILPVYMRIVENKTLMFNVQMMMRTIQLAKLQTMLEWPINKTYLNKTEVDNFTQLLNETEEWFMKTLNETKDVPLYEEKKVKGKDFEERSKKLAQEMYRISMIQPPPKKSVFNTLTNKTSGWMSKIRNFFRNRSQPPAKKKPAASSSNSNRQKQKPKPKATKSETPKVTQTPQKPQDTPQKPQDAPRKSQDAPQKEAQSENEKNNDL